MAICSAWFRLPDDLESFRRSGPKCLRARDRIGNMNVPQIHEKPGKPDRHLRSGYSRR